jgi:hypothetical protein
MMDRRTFVKTGAWLAATGCVLPRLVLAARTAGAVAVFDSTLAHGRALADHAARANLLKFDVGDDIGALWYSTLAPHLARAPGVLIGVTRPADYFVLTHCVPYSALTTCDVREAGSRAPVAFVIDCSSSLTWHPRGT